MSTQQPTIIYTLTDEAPLLATSAFLPIIRTFAAPAGMQCEPTSDISVAGPCAGTSSPSYLPEAQQRVPDTLAELGKLTLKPEANIIKLPNISASVGQLMACHQGTAGQGLRPPGLPGSPRRPTKKRPSAPVTPSARARREPGAARRQLRPPRAQGREGIRPQEPAQHGRVEPGFAQRTSRTCTTATSTTVKSP